MRNLFLIVFLSLLSPLAQATPPPPFATPAGLEEEVRFWKAVFASYDHQHVIIHDARHLKVVYAVLDFSRLNARKELTSAQKRELRIEVIREKTQEIETALKRLATRISPPSPYPLPRGEGDLSSEERYYELLFRDIDEKDKLAAAASRIRIQIGQRDHLTQAIVKSASYMGDIEAIFEKYGLPPELAGLIFIESMFNPKALSEAGALGLWQFMPDTGKEYVSMNAFWDERSDPLRSSQGAAQFLADLYRQTKDWPLAINAYHSGLGRLARAQSLLKTKDIATIIHRYDGPDYGFYSRNYYPEFLAMVDIYKNRKDALGLNDAEHNPLHYDIVKTAEFVQLPELTQRFAIESSVLRTLNPAIKKEVLDGELPLPPYYELKVPKGLGYYIALSVGQLAP